MIDKKVYKEIIKRIGKDKAFIDKEILYTYSYDATGKHYLPDLVVIPEDEDDIKMLIKIAYKNKIPITPRGAGVGYSGGALPVNGGIVLVFTKMQEVKINPQNFTAEVQPGVITLDLQEECKTHGLFYPPDPASLKTSTIGGNVAENAGGPRCFKYGVTGNYILGLEGFLINGERFRAGSAIIKNVAGYNFKSLLVGSEGTLAIITKIIIKLIPLPEKKELLRIDFSSLQTGAEFINLIINSGIAPSVLEFMDRSSMEAACNYLEIALDKKVNASLIIELDGNFEDVRYRKEKLLNLLNNDSILFYMFADNLEQEALIWELRRNISPAIAKLKPKKINEDIVVPVYKIPDTVKFINNLAKELNLLIVLFGHFGDGNIHTNIMVNPDDNNEMKRANIALKKIFEYIVKCGGSISGEHGIGLSKKDFMSFQFNNTELNILKNIKKAFDPENLLNPGKIF